MLRYQLAHSEESPKFDSFVSVSLTFSNLSHSIILVVLHPLW